MDRALRFPPRLTVGDTIGILAPSGDSSARFPHRVENGVSCLEKLGFQIKLYPSVFKSVRGSAGEPEERAADLHRAFKDTSVKAIIATIGGLTTNEILEYLDFDLMYENPKLFCGYSYCTLLNSALLAKGPLVSFYGPGLVAEFGEYPFPPEYTIKSFLEASEGRILDVQPATVWTDELLNWETRSDLSRPRVYRKNTIGFVALRAGQAYGNSFFACLPSLVSLLGSEYVPSLKNMVLFIETPEGEMPGLGMSVSEINSALGTLRMAGVFKEISGLVVGRVYGHSESKHHEIFDVIKFQTRGYSFPIIANVDFGHTDPQLTLPCGVPVSICTEDLSVRFHYSGVV